VNAKIPREPDGRPLFIGQAPGHPGPVRPLEGRNGKRLASLLGVSVEEYLSGTDRVNLLNEYPGRAGNGDAFPLDAARAAAREMLPRLKGRVVILLGRGVARAFGVRANFLEIEHRDGVTFATIPHPSGRNRWWNDPANVERAARFLRENVRSSIVAALCEDNSPSEWFSIQHGDKRLSAFLRTGGDGSRVAASDAIVPR